MDIEWMSEGSSLSGNQFIQVTPMRVWWWDDDNENYKQPLDVKNMEVELRKLRELPSGQGLQGFELNKRENMRGSGWNGELDKRNFMSEVGKYTFRQIE